MTAITRSAHIPHQRTMNTVHLYDTLDRATLAEALDNGHIRQQVHPTEPLAVLNYTERCAYENAWTPVTLACRGLIWRTDTGHIAARGYNKFFNHGQPGCAPIDLDASVVATDKMDGSLGVVYPLPSGGWAVATRGSFASEQALHATRVFNTRYAGWCPPDGVTVLVEIVYPANRIVVDYGDLDDLILLGAVDNATGRPVPPASAAAVYGWPGPVADTLHVGSFGEVLALPPRPNAEGLVVHDVTAGTLVKIKQADYVALHRIVTGLNARTVWEHLVAGLPLAELVAPLPDEFHPWCQEVAAGIEAAVEQRHAELVKAYDELAASLPVGASRKDFALQAVRHSDKWAMFALLDGRNIRPELLKRSRPEPYLTPTGRTYGEDVA